MKMNVQYRQLGDYRLVVNPILGQGATGKVYYGVNMKDKTKVAVKQIQISKLTNSLAKQIQNQIKNLTQLVSPYIVKLYKYFKHDKYLYLFLEYCEDGDLKTYLEKKKGAGLCENQALLFMKHIIEGYRTLYEHNIIHRDIKPANILLKQGIAKLSDFGFSRVVDNPQISQKLTLLGSPLYTANEILKGNQFSNKCDVWSMGVVFYEMLQGRSPWTGNDLQDLKQNIQNKPLVFKDNNIKNIKIRNLIKSMLDLDSKNRISWSLIFTNQLFQRIKLQSPITPQQQLSIQQIKKKFFEYMQTHVVKTYLRLNMNDINFRQSYEPSDQSKKVVQQISKQITHKRNLAFMYLYVLALFYKNQGEKLFASEVNKYMDFQYALVLKAYGAICVIGNQYFSEKAPENIIQWGIFQKSSQYEQLRRILQTDSNVVDILKKCIRKHAIKQVTEGKMNQDTGKYFTALEKDFQNAFEKVMKHNLKQFQKKSNGVSNLICDYIKNYVLNPGKLQSYLNLDMGAFYQNREIQYGLV